MSVDQLVAALRQALDEDEKIALAAPSCLNRAEWPFWVDVDDDDEYAATNAWRDRLPPARVLRQVAAHRKILAAHTPQHAGYDCPTCWQGAEDGGPMVAPCPTILALAEVYGLQDSTEEGRSDG